MHVKTKPEPFPLSHLLAFAFTRAVPWPFIFRSAPRAVLPEFLTVGGRHVPVAAVRNPRARRYILRLRPDRSARVTIPRGGSMAEACRFLERHHAWLERQLQKLAAQPTRPKEWLPGTEILFRGEPTKIEAGLDGHANLIRLGPETIKVADSSIDLRRPIERHLWKLAAKELPLRVREYLAVHPLPVRRITVRNQRSRWGSCSRQGTISLNWRLVQTPPFVRDYIILHELMHLRHMNHSARFWREVEVACPYYETAERWLKQHSSLLR